MKLVPYFYLGQFGTENTITSFQGAEGNFAKVNQYGTTDTTNINQLDGFNTAIVTQGD